MAMSNWDHLVFDQQGKPDGTNRIVSMAPVTGSIRIEVYKSWLNIYSNEQMIISELLEGKLSLHGLDQKPTAPDVALWVAQAPDYSPRGVYFLARAGHDPEHMKVVAGVGVYAYCDCSERPCKVHYDKREGAGWEGVRLSDRKILAEYIREWEEHDPYIGSFDVDTLINNIETGKV